MKLSEELKIKLAEKAARMQSILNARKENGILRAATTEETTEYDGLKASVTTLDTDIAEAETVEARTLETPAKRSVTIVKEAKPYNVSKAIREFASGGAHKLTGIEAEQHQELSRGISSNGLLVPYHQRAVADTTTNAAGIDLLIAPGISIVGKEPLYQSMGCTILPGLQGSFKLGKKTADVAAKYAEKAAITGKPTVPTFVTMSPERYGITETWDKELLAQENPAVHAAIMNDMVKSIDRKLTAEVYVVALAAATEVASGALTMAGFNDLMAAVDVDGAFAMTRASFFTAKGVAIDSGSGKFLTTLTGKNGIGLTHDGANAFYSTLFADGVNAKYAIYGAFSEIFIGMWGGLELLLDPYTLQESGQIRTTVNKLADVICRNSGVFVKSPDLDAAV